MPVTVNGEKIEESVIHNEIERLRPDYEKTFPSQSAEETEQTLIEWSRENVIERVLLAQKAKAEIADEPEKVEKIFEGMKNRFQEAAQKFEQLEALGEEKLKEVITQQMRVGKLLEQVRKDAPKPTEEEMMEYFEQNRDRFKTPLRVHIAHMVKHVNWQMNPDSAKIILQQAKAELQSGVMFEALVRRYSDCPENDGDLGYVSPGIMVKEFEDIVFNLAPKQVSDIFKTRFGFHIAKCYDRKEPQPLEFDKVKDSIEKELTAGKQEKAVENFIDELKEKAAIEID